MLHARPVLTRKQIESAVSANAILAPSESRRRRRAREVHAAPAHLEELSKLWSVFFQTTYRLSRRLPRHRRPARGGRPVRRRRCRVLRAEPLRRDAPRADGRGGRRRGGRRPADPRRRRRSGSAVTACRGRTSASAIDDEPATAVTVVDDTELTCDAAAALRVGRPRAAGRARAQAGHAARSSTRRRRRPTSSPSCSRRGSTRPAAPTTSARSTRPRGSSTPSRCTRPTCGSCSTRRSAAASASRSCSTS